MHKSSSVTSVTVRRLFYLSYLVIMAKETFLKRLSSKLGPGLVTGASDDDPAGILTYLQAGVVLGLSSLWMALTLPLMYVISGNVRSNRFRYR